MDDRPTAFVATVFLFKEDSFAELFHSGSVFSAAMPRPGAIPPNHANTAPIAIRKIFLVITLRSLFPTASEG